MITVIEEHVVESIIFAEEVIFFFDLILLWFHTCEGKYIVFRKIILANAMSIRFEVAIVNGRKLSLNLFFFLSSFLVSLFLEIEYFLAHLLNLFNSMGLQSRRAFER